MPLIEYKKKRHFQRTREPAGKIAPKGGHSFVIQKHDASHLHYDFRLELDGVLKSWAVPKGPSLDPTVKRLAMQVEDHPVDYGSFEGIIPKGEYGGGTVMLWDRGTWEAVGDAQEGYEHGRLKFMLHGDKLHGGWMLVKIGGVKANKDKPQWLLFKERDADARPEAKGDVREELPLSVSTGRTMEEIAADRDSVWTSQAESNGKLAAAPPQAKEPAPAARRARSAASGVPGPKSKDVPARIEVQLATLAREAPEGDAWFHEIKLDGYHKPAKEVTRPMPVSIAKAAKSASAPSKAAPRLRAASAKERPPRKESKPKRKGSADTTDYDKAKQEFAGVRLTSPDKVLYPEQGITKLELANYYQAVADWILPHLADRPLVLVRCPEGRDKECFYQKHPGRGTPETLRRIPVREKSKTEDYVIVDDVRGLISLAQMGALEIHAWGSRADKLEQPDRLIFDLDPDTDVAWNTVVDSARQVRQFLQELGLESFVKTTGGKGLHLVVPIERRHDWDEAKPFCKQVADAIVAADPTHYTANMSKAARPGKIFIDYLRNGRGATAITPYSTRARSGAPISVPLTWQELSPRIHSDQYNVRNIGKRLASLKRDPWEALASMRQGLGAALGKVRSLGSSGT